MSASAFAANGTTLRSGCDSRITYAEPRSGAVMPGPEPLLATPAQSPAGGARRGMPACANSFIKSEGQYSYTTVCTKRASYGGQATRPVRVSIVIARCTSLTRIGDLPGMNHVVARSGQ